jgi:tetratricopeptide (TPR) repeat protein
VRGYPERHFDVLHLTGHADHLADGPRFLTESATGTPEWVAAADLARAVPHRPSLTFLSGCRTGQSLAAGAVPSLAEELLNHGFPAVLGWGRPVFDADAIVAAAALYDRLAAGFTPVEAVLHAHGEMLRTKAHHWHLLRLFVAGATPAAPVTAPRTAGRKKAPLPTNARRFLGKKGNRGEAVVDRKDFVGRRRPLQRFIRALRSGDQPAGAVIFGLGGVGKSSLACRLCDRLEEFEPVVHVGVLDEPGLLRSLEQASTSDDERAALQGSRDPLRHRLRAFLEARQGAGRKKLFIVLDDFEQNTPLDQDQPLIRPEAQDVLEALVWGIEQTDAARCLITSRYRLMTSQARHFFQEELSALREAERDKKRRGLVAYRDATPEFRQRADRVSDGNPRLMERLDLVLGQPGLDHAGLLERLGATAAEYREEILARELVSHLPVPTRQLLAGLLVCQLPVPFEVVAALFPGRSSKELHASLDGAAALGLVEQEPDGTITVYRVPRLLEALLEPDRPGDPHIFVVAAVETLVCLWCKDEQNISELQALELLRLACESQRADIAVPIANVIGPRWLEVHRYREAHSLYEATVAAVGRDYRLLGWLGQAANVLGDGEQAHQLVSEALEKCPSDDTGERSFLLSKFSHLLVQFGQLDKALRILRDELLPVFERLGDVRSRAVTLGKVANILRARGQLDEALRIYQDEVVPVFERLGDVRSRAGALGLIADILVARGQLDEALRILQDEVVPPLRQLQDPQALTQMLLRLGMYSIENSQQDQALPFLNEARDCYIRLGDEKTIQFIDQVLQRIAGETMP